MMLKLTALTGDSPLGWLAAVGTLRLLNKFGNGGALLAWDRADHTALLFGRDSIATVVEELAKIIDAMPAGSVLPGLSAGFPRRDLPPDKLNVPDGELGHLHENLVNTLPRDEFLEATRWLNSLVTDLNTIGERNKVATSQMTAGVGQQTTYTMFQKPLTHVRKDPDVLRQGLEQWRRVPGVTGEFLDHRALWDSTQDGHGKPSMRGVPGATWLALMAFPLFRTTISPRGRTQTSGWHEVKSRRRVDELRLPLWEDPANLETIVFLLEHPLFERYPVGQSPAEERRWKEALGVLRIFHVCRARRFKPSGSKSAGVLTPH